METATHTLQLMLGHGLVEEVIVDLNSFNLLRQTGQ